MKRWILSLALLLPATSAAASDATPSAKSAILIEATTGKVLFAKRTNVPLPPASMTKMMTLLLVAEALERKELRLTDRVIVSEHAASMGGSQIFLAEGETMTVDELLQAVALASANDAAVALAEKVAGSERAFVALMNERAQQLRMTNTTFANPTGLPLAHHVSSAADMATLAAAVVRHPRILSYTKQYEAYLRRGSKQPFWLVNTNRLVKQNRAIDGLKTGFTNEAKYCVTATMKGNGIRVIGVIMGAPSSKVRNSEMMALLQQAVNRYTTKTIPKPIRPLIVQGGTKETVAVTGVAPLTVVVERAKASQLQWRIQLPKAVRAPVKKGTVVGKVIVGRQTFPLVAATDVAEASFWQQWKSAWKMLLRD